MKVHDTPLVILVSRPQVVSEGVTALLAEYGLNEGDWRRDSNDAEGDALPELMGRLCYGSFGPRQGRIGSREYLSHVIEGGHGSVLEHACWGFVACRASRGFTHQMVRHRAGFAFSQESQHFIKYGEGKGTQEPAICATGISGAARETMILAGLEAVEGYTKLWDEIRASFPDDATGLKKIVSGAARGLLPGAMESRLGFTANARALRHFCELRGQQDNVLEIRLVAVQVAVIMRHEAPAIFDDVWTQGADDGWPIVQSAHRKV